MIPQLSIATRWHDNETGWEEHPAGTPVELVLRVDAAEKDHERVAAIEANLKRQRARGENWVAVRIAGFVGCVDRRWVE